MKYTILILTILILLIGCSPATTTTTTSDITTTTVMPVTTTKFVPPTQKPTTTQKVTTTKLVTTTSTTTTTTAADQELIINDNEDPNTAVIDVTTNPKGVEIRINNEYFGVSPKVKAIEPGVKRINLAKTGLKSYTKEFTAEIGKKYTFNIDMSSGSTMGFATVTFDSRPQGAQVLINNRAYGFTPVIVPNLMVANQQVKIVLVNYKDYNQYKDIEDGMTINVTLEKL